jgi:hypothetical protein
VNTGVGWDPAQSGVRGHSCPPRPRESDAFYAIMRSARHCFTGVARDEALRSAPLRASQEPSTSEKEVGSMSVRNTSSAFGGNAPTCEAQS